RSGALVALWLCPFYRTASFGTPVASQNEVRRASQLESSPALCTFSPLRLDDANTFLELVASRRSNPHVRLRYRPDIIQIFQMHVRIEEVRGYRKGSDIYYDQLLEEKQREATARAKIGRFEYAEVGPMPASIAIPSSEGLEIAGILPSFDESALIAL